MDAFGGISMGPGCVWQIRQSQRVYVLPVKFDPSDALPYSRSRFAWSSETLFEGLSLWTEKEYFRAYVTAPGVSNSQWIRPGWTWDQKEGICFPTFMKSTKRSRAPGSCWSASDLGRDPAMMEEGRVQVSTIPIQGCFSAHSS